MFQRIITSDVLKKTCVSLRALVVASCGARSNPKSGFPPPPRLWGTSRNPKFLSSAYTLIEVLVAASLFAVGIFTMVTMLRWTTEATMEIQDGTVFQKDLDGVLRQEIDAASQMTVTTDLSSTNAVTTGIRVRFMDRASVNTDLYFQGDGFYLKRDGQAAFALIAAGVTNGVFDLSSGALDVQIGSDRGSFSNRYEWRKNY